MTAPRVLAQIVNGKLWETVEVDSTIPTHLLFPQDQLWVDATGKENLVYGAPYDGSNFSSPAPVTRPIIVPEVVEMWQAQAVLRGMPNLPNGTPMYSAIDSYIQGLGDATLLSAWERSNFVHRNGQLFKAVADHFGMSASQLDALFVQAAAIQP